MLVINQVININNIITTTLHPPMGGVINKIYRLLDNKATVGQIKSIIDPIVVHWLEHAMSTRLIAITDTHCISGVTECVRDDVYEILATHVYNVYNITHMRRVHYKSYIVNDSLYILLRSCWEVG